MYFKTAAIILTLTTWPRCAKGQQIRGGGKLKIEPSSNSTMPLDMSYHGGFPTIDSEKNPFNNQDYIMQEESYVEEMLPIKESDNGITIVDGDGDGHRDLATSAATAGVGLCAPNGGACACGKTGDGKLITLNRFWGNNNDEKVWGCGGAFELTSAQWNSQWGGKLTAQTPEANVAHTLGINFAQGSSFDGWEGCCYICGANLQLARKLSPGWYCEKDFFSTGIWLKGVNKG